MRASHILNTLRTIAVYCLDTIAPPDPAVREIELMSPEEFYERASVVEHAHEIGTINATRPRDPLPAHITAFLPYQNRLTKTALVEIKTVRNVALARIIARAIYPHLIKRLNPAGLMSQTRPLLVTVPMTKRALRARGWNQCELLAREICVCDTENDFDPRFDALIKIRETGDQVGKNRAERMENISSCMKVNPRRDVNGRTVIVLDDIITTGATLEEARRALLQAGARAVICVAVAF